MKPDLIKIDFRRRRTLMRHLGLLLFSQEPRTAAPFHRLFELVHRFLGNNSALTASEFCVRNFNRRNKFEPIAFPFYPHFESLRYGILFAREAATLDRHPCKSSGLGREFNFHAHIVT
jgi:hypothetical protein